MRPRPNLRPAVLAALAMALLAVVGAACGGDEPRAAAAPKVAPTETTSAHVAAVDPRPLARPAATTPAGPGEGATDEDLAAGSNPLPADSALALPPMIHLAVDDAPGAAAGAGKAVLGSKQLALAPAARRSVVAGKVSAAALGLLVRLAPAAGPQLLVFAARGGRLRVQATSLAATRDIVTSVGGIGGAVHLELRPVRPDFADVAQSKAQARQANAGARAVAIALTQVGVPYSWGGGGARGPTTGTCDGYHGSVRPCPATRTIGYDCSGLTLFAYAQVGITLDHYAAFQWLEGKRIEINALAPGDLVFFNPKADGPGHVGIYVGNGSFIQAPHTGDVVKVSPLSAYARSYMGAVRPG